MTIALAFDADQDVTKVIERAKTEKVVAAARYLKNLTLAEAKALSAAGIKIISIYESTAERALGGAVQGAIDGATAQTQGAALGQPKESAIYATVDFDVTLAQQPTVLSYLKAFDDTHGFEMGVYANGAVCQEAIDGQLVDYTWVAGGSGMRGTKEFIASGLATMVQDVGDKRRLDLGISIDSDAIEKANFGGWLLT